MINQLENTRITEDLLAFYTFNAGSGNTIYDTSGIGDPLNLSIADSDDVSWGDSVLNINAPALISSLQPAQKIVSGAAASSALTLEAWLTPQNINQSSLAHILTLSATQRNRNFTLGQTLDSYEVRLRTTHTSNRGNPALVSPTGSAVPGLTHLVYTRDANGNTGLYLNNQLVSNQTVTGSFANWNSDFRLALGNEIKGGRPWLGSLDLVAIYGQSFDAKKFCSTSLA
ncbi:MAG: LamG domain-containing protein, partial [Leptolyngbya sp. SIO4C1]|nr:LamG domain-containing protein [Leptolyngbya sp. SIO4C1]